MVSFMARVQQVHLVGYRGAFCSASVADSRLQDKETSFFTTTGSFCGPADDTQPPSCITTQPDGDKATCSGAPVAARCPASDGQKGTQAQPAQSCAPNKNHTTAPKTLTEIGRYCTTGPTQASDWRKRSLIRASFFGYKRKARQMVL